MRRLRELARDVRRMTDGDYYFDGDPSTDSARRHLERVLKETKPRRKWPWIAAAVTGAAAWYLWPRDKAAGAKTPARQAPSPAVSRAGSRDAAALEERPDDR